MSWRDRIKNLDRKVKREEKINCKQELQSCLDLFICKLNSENHDQDFIEARVIEIHKKLLEISQIKQT